MSVDLPMRARPFLAAGNEDIKASLTVQFGPQLNRQRPLLKRRSAIHEHSASQRLTVLGRQ